ncbi:metallophosphoesterase, partial [bacterium]|nr:metallophosphoesterase [bacterium]
MFKKSVIFVILILVIQTSLCFAAHEIDIIRRPILNIPAIVERGGEFEVICDAPSDDMLWYIYLENPVTGSYLHRADFYYDDEDHRWHMNVDVSHEIPFELYDLRVRSSTGITDKVRNAVRVVPGITDDYYFIQITDTHIPSRLVVLSVPVYSDDNTVEEMTELMREFRFMNPEFVIHTGDLIDYCAQEFQYEVAQDLLAESEVPIYVIPGNNDLKDLDTYPIPGRITWRRFYGNILDYHFNYGNDFYCGLHSFDSPSPLYSFTDDQMTFLEEALNWSNSRGDEMQTVFYHCDFRRFDGDGPQITDALVDEYGVDLTLYGHRFLDEVGLLGSRSIPDIVTSQTCNDNGAFRVIRISNGQVTSYKLHHYLDFAVDFEPPNNGQNYSMIATIDNNLDEHFDNTLLKFFMPRNARDIIVDGGDILQTIYSDTMVTCYVQLDMPPYRTKYVSINSVEGIDEFSLVKKPASVQIWGYPNPFNSSICIEFNLPSTTYAPFATGSILIHNVRGEVVREFTTGSLASEIRWDGCNDDGGELPSGIYFASISYMEYKDMTKLILIR